MSIRCRSVVFIHGLWLHESSWAPWAKRFTARGYVPLCPGWPGECGTVAASRLEANRVANVGIGAVTAHFAHVIRGLPELPIVIGHSMGGLIAQKLLGMGLAAAAVAISPAQMRGVLPLPLKQLRSFFPILRNPANYTRSTLQSSEHFHRTFGNTLSRRESDALHASFSIPSPARPLFEAALANYVKGSAAAVNVERPGRGPLLILASGQDVAVPESVCRAVHAQYRRAQTLNEYRVFRDRGHTLILDSGWSEVADAALQWLERKEMAPPRPAVWQTASRAAAWGLSRGGERPPLAPER